MYRKVYYNIDLAVFCPCYPIVTSRKAIRLKYILTKGINDALFIKRSLPGL